VVLGGGVGGTKTGRGFLTKGSHAKGQCNLKREGHLHTPKEAARADERSGGPCPEGHFLPLDRVCKDHALRGGGAHPIQRRTDWQKRTDIWCGKLEGLAFPGKKKKLCYPNRGLQT